MTAKLLTVGAALGRDPVARKARWIARKARRIARKARSYGSKG